MKKSSIAVIGLFILLYILPLGARPIVIPDESRYAEIPREMLASGDWVVPHLNGLRYFEKPVLGYWLNAASMMLFGENAFAIRFPSAVATGISALMVFLLVRRFTGGYSAGLLAAVAFLTCLEVFGIGTFNVPDSAFSMFLTVGMCLFLFAYMEGNPGTRRLFLTLFGIFCGLAFLTKGFIAFSVPAVAILPFMIWEQRWKELLRVCWLPVVAAILISLPWAVMIHLREPDFWHYFFWIEHVKRFISPTGGQHFHSVWFFIPIILEGALPWTVLIPAAILGMRRTRFKDPMIRFAICWFLFPFLFFSASRGKLGTYILPCFPPLVILITIGLRKYLEGRKKRAFTVGASFLAMATGILAITLVVSQVTDFLGIRAYGPAETWKWVVGAAGLVVWSGLGAWSIRSLIFQKRMVLNCAAPLLFMFSAHLIVPDQVVQRKAPGGFLMRQADRVRPDITLVSDGGAVGAVCWFYKRNDVLLLGKGGELSYGLGYKSSRYRRLSVDQLRDLVTKTHGVKSVVLVAKAKDYAQYRSLLRKSVFQDIGGRFVFAQL